MSLIQTINHTREKIISEHYNSCLAQLTELIENQPFQTSFTLFSGCVSLEMTNEISRRFAKNGLKSVVQQSGVMNRGFSIILTVPLESSIEE